MKIENFDRKKYEFKLDNIIKDMHNTNYSNEEVAFFLIQEAFIFMNLKKFTEEETERILEESLKNLQTRTLSNFNTQDILSVHI